MPEVNYQGRIRKIACAPCIRGHRSSKCQHFDRMMYEVRKPGRPLTTCSHPPGPCPTADCESDEVLYTVPAQDTDCGYTLMVGALINLERERRPSNRRAGAANGGRRQNGGRPHARRNSTSVRQSRSAPDTPAADTNGSQQAGVTPGSASSSTTTDPQAEVKPEEASAAYTTPQNNHELRLGMMGVGGYQASPDQVGWNGEWPVANNLPAILASQMQLNGASDSHSIVSQAISHAATSNGSPHSATAHSPHMQLAANGNGASIHDHSLQQPMAIGMQIPHRPIVDDLNGMDVEDLQHHHRLALFRGQRMLNSAVGAGSSQSSISYQLPLQSLELVNDETEAMRMMGQIDQGCDCGGDCECQACPIHADNSATRRFVMEEFAAHQELPDIPTPMEEVVNGYELPMRSPLEPIPPNNSEDGNALWHMLNNEYRSNYPVQNHDDFHMQQIANHCCHPAATAQFNQHPAAFAGCGQDACNCGEGCLCMGCLTHNGHNGETIAPLSM